MHRYKAMLLGALCLVFAMAAASGCGAGKTQAPREEITVFAAASLTDALKECGKSYEALHPEVKLVYNFGGSGALQKQIEAGAPADLFLSASPKQMNALKQGGLIDLESAKDLLRNKVVLIAGKDSDPRVRSFADLKSPEVKKIALGEPKGVPVGQYAEAILRSLRLLDAVRPKAVYGSDVRQVLGWVAAGEADCGVVYATDAAVSREVMIVAEAPEGSHDPVLYPAAVVKSAKHGAQAKALLDYLAGPESKTVFARYGFAVK